MTDSFGLRSTGLVVFAGRMISAFTGLLFTVMVARWLSVSNFGTWEVIVTLVTISAYPVGVVSYWATRDVARGRMVGRTALVLGTLLSGVGLLLYFGLSFVTYSRIGAAVLPFILGALIVPLSYWSGVANAIVQGFRPGIYGYSLVISEFAKLGVAYEALYGFRLGIDGVMLALMAAYFVQSLVSTYFVRQTTDERLDGGLWKRWSRLSWLPAVSSLPTVVAVADTYLVALAFGTVIVGYYQAAFLVASVVGYSLSLTFSLYPLLLRGGDERLPALSIGFTLLFSVPMAVGCVVLASPVLFLFGGKYLPGALGLSILGVAFVFTTVSGVLDQTLLGTERADEEARPGFRALVRSNLLFVPVVNILFGVVYVVSLLLALGYSNAAGFSQSSSVGVWAVVQLVFTVLFMLVKARRARRYARLMPSRSVAYYFIAGAAMAVVLYALSGFASDQSLGTLAYGSRLLAVGAAGLVTYGGVLYAIDAEFRDMLRSLGRRT